MGQSFTILILNAGSSSWKCSLFQIGPEKNSFLEPVWEGFLDFGKAKEDQLYIEIKQKGAAPVYQEQLASNRDEAIYALIQTAWNREGSAISSPNEISCVGHRVVHGGDQFIEPTLLTAEIRKKLSKLSSLAPLHNPSNMEGIELMEKLLPSCPQIAVFDTAFHSTMPMAMQTYAIPLQWRKLGIKRYGFHGISHAYCAKRVANLLGKDLSKLNILSCHLGNGCSLTAIREGKSLATTMGFTPLEGLIMGSRSGSIDPGILLHLLREEKINTEELSQKLFSESGLLGIAGTSDMRKILSLKKEGHPDALLAFEMYVTQLCWHMGAMLACLGRPDAIIFTAGIGENSSEVRQAACQQMRPWGFQLHEENNQSEGFDKKISQRDAPFPIFIIKTREELEIAQSCVKTLGLTF